MALIQVSSTQQNFADETQGKNYFPINRGYSFSNPFNGSLEIPPYSQLAIHSGCFTFNSEEIVIGQTGGSLSFGSNIFRMFYASNKNGDDLLNVPGQITEPVSQAVDADGNDWGQKYTTKCGFLYFAPVGTFKSTSEYLEKLVNTLNIDSRPQLYKSFSYFTSTNGGKVNGNIQSNANITLTNVLGYISSGTYSGFKNYTFFDYLDDNFQPTLSLVEDIPGTAFFTSVQKTIGGRPTKPDEPAVAQTNCTGILNGLGAFCITEGYVAPADGNIFGFASNRAMFGISKAGGNAKDDPNWSKYFSMAGLGYKGILGNNGQKYEDMYQDFVTEDPLNANYYRWMRFMKRCVMSSGNVSIRASEVFEYCFMILGAVDDQAFNQFDNVKGLEKGGFRFIPAGRDGAGYRYYILKLQFNNKYGFFYMPIATGDEQSSGYYHINYSIQLNPTTNSDPKKQFGIGFGDESVYSATAFRFAFEGNLIQFLTENQGIGSTTTVEVDSILSPGATIPLYAELSDINYPLQMKWSICYGPGALGGEGAIWKDNVASWVTADQVQEPIVFRGKKTSDFKNYVESQSMLPAWIYNEQYWNFSPDEDGGAGDLVRTPNLCFRSNDSDLYDNIQLLFKDEEQTQNVAKTGYWVNNVPYIQLGPNDNFDTQVGNALAPNMSNTIGIDLDASVFEDVWEGTEDSGAIAFGRVTLSTGFKATELPFSSGMYIRLKNLPCRSVFGSINQTTDKLIGVLNRFDNFYENTSSATESVYAFQEYEKIYISLNNPSPIVVSSLDFEIVDRYGRYQEIIDKTVLVLHLKKDVDGGLYDYDRSKLSLASNIGFSI